MPNLIKTDIIRYTAVVGLSALLCAGCGGGGSGNSTPPPVTNPPPTANSGLLTDAQLRTRDDPSRALVNGEAASWFGQNANTVRSLTEDEDFSDLEFFTPILADKRLVMLGESSHGAKQFSQAKIRLIKYLHEEQGFNVLAFEGGLFDCETAKDILARGNPNAALNSCLFGVWRTQALRELFAYVAETQLTNNPLQLTGFDVQASGASFSQRASATAALVEKVSPSFALTVREQEQEFFQLTLDASAATFDNDPVFSTINTRLALISVAFTELADYLQSNIDLITADGEFSRQDVLIAAQYARTSPSYLTQLRNRFLPGGGGRARDSGMARNLIALATTIYPDEKIIGWAHNAHLRHEGTGFLQGANMGALVHDELADQMYTVGFYMYRGQHAFNDRSIQEVAAPQNYSLEALFHNQRLFWLFLDIENADTDAVGAAWLDQSTPTYAWGSFPISLKLNQEYDGLFLIDTTTAPDYLQ